MADIPVARGTMFSMFSSPHPNTKMLDDCQKGRRDAGMKKEFEV